MSDFMKYLDQLAKLTSAPREDDIYSCLARQEDEMEDSSEQSTQTALEKVRVLSELQLSLENHPLLKAYHLQADELQMIAHLCHQAKTRGDQNFSYLEICAMLPGMAEGFQQRIQKLTGLLEREILSFAYSVDSDFHFNISELLESNFRLNAYLWNLLRGINPFAQAFQEFGQNLKAPQTSIKAALNMIGVLFMNYQELVSRMDKPNGIYYGKTVNKLLNAILKKLLGPEVKSPWSAFIDEFKLDVFWQKTVLLVLYFNVKLSKEPEPFVIASFLASSRKEFVSFVSRLEGVNLLHSSGLQEIQDLRVFKNSMELSQKTYDWLLPPKTEENDSSRTVEQILATSNYFTQLDTSQTLEQLILSRPGKETLVSILQRLKNPNPDGFTQWGLLNASLSSDSNIQKGCNILLFGSPGTGKTFIAGVMANELGRPLIQINANNIRYCLYGSTEKNARELFSEMRILAKICDPIFLLNEGDQLIHKRNTDSQRSTDMAENTIQSIFLEELENFPGTFVVTTNLQVNLDEAMSRRFHFKLEIPEPDFEARLALWSLHLPDSIPGAANLPLDALAKDFLFSGGQIRIVVQNACHFAFLRGENASLTLHDLYKFANLEKNSSFESGKISIGF